MKKPSQIIFYFVLTILAVSLSACSPFSDDNYATTAELSESNLISIPSFTVDESVITKGDPIILDWSVTDDDPTYDIDYITITPNVGNVAQSGSTQVTPTASTTYTLEVYVKGTISGEAVTGELARARMLQITVLDAAGAEIEEEPEAEVCDDGEDNDRDILTDCDDDDCAEDSACADVEVTYGFTSYNVSPDAPEIGDEVTLSWESNCDLVTSDGFSGTKSGTDSYTFTIESETKTIALYCYVEGGLKGSETILVTATEPVIPDEPEFNARVSFKATPTTELIYGMPFCIEWSVDGATEVSLKGPGDGNYRIVDRNGGSECKDTATGDNQGTYYLKVVDEQGLDNGSGKTLSITVNQFSSGTDSGMSDIIGRIPTKTDGEYYFISASKIYYTADYGQNIETKSTSGWSGEISTLAVDTSGNLYLGTSKGVYLSTDTDKSIFTKILDSDGESINAVYAKDTKNILVGTDEILVKVHPESEGCLDSTGTVSTQVLNGYCFVAHDFNQRSEFEDYVNGGELHVYKFIPKVDSSSKVVMITSDDSGAFYSTDGGDSFDNLGISITNGVWLDSDHGYFWYNKNDHEDYETEKHSIWYYDDGEFISLGQDSSIENIQDVAEINGKTFIATEYGVFYEYNDEWLVSDLESSVSYLMPYKSDLYSILGFASDGTEYQLSWGTSMLLRSGIILPELNLFD